MKWRFVTAERLHICDVEMRRKPQPEVGDVFDLAFDDEQELSSWEVIHVDAEFRHATCEPFDDDEGDDEGDDDEGDDEEGDDEG